MSKAIRRELSLPQPVEQVWRAIATSVALADWMFPNDFEPRVGHTFTFRVPPNPKANFDGLTVQSEVLECEAPNRLVFSWSAGGAVVNTRVSFRLEAEGGGTRLFFEHSGFDFTHEWGEQAFRGAEFGWAKMLGQLPATVTAAVAVATASAIVGAGADVDVADAANSLATSPSGASAALRTERVLSASSKRVFEAFEKPAQLAEWWGPNGFTNTFQVFEFKPGGRWVFVMHSANGADYPNESIFREIDRDTKIVIEHVAKPWFRLSVTLTTRGDATNLVWIQEFETPEVAAKMRPICEPANEQNLNRLNALLTRASSTLG